MSNIRDKMFKFISLTFHHFDNCPWDVQRESHWTNVSGKSLSGGTEQNVDKK